MLWLVCPHCNKEFGVVWATSAAIDPGPYYVIEIPKED